MSRIKSEIQHLEAHVRTLKIGTVVLCLLAVGMGLGWWTAPRNLTIHVPPDLRSGSTRKWWEVPPESVYAFTYYVWQQLHAWPLNGEEDYRRNQHALSAYLTPACRDQLAKEYQERQEAGELRQRIRSLHEIPGRGYGERPALRVRTVSNRDWVVTLDVNADEFHGEQRVKRAQVRYPLKVTQLDINPALNPWGLAIDCYDGAPQRIVMPEAPSP